MAKHAKLDIALPSGGMTPIGYVAIEFSIMKQKACEVVHDVHEVPETTRCEPSGFVCASFRP